MGDGHSIYVNRDPWIPKEVGFLSDEGLLPIHVAMRVCDLFVEGERT